LSEVSRFARNLVCAVALVPLALAAGVGPSQIQTIAAAPEIADPEADDLADVPETWQARVSGTGTLGLRIRSGPTANAPVAATLPEGSRIEVLEGPVMDGQGREWYRVSSQGRSTVVGWCVGGYLVEVDANEPAPAQVASARAATPPAAAPSGRSFQARLTAYAHGTRTASGTPVRWGVVAVDPRVIPLGSRIMIEGFDNVFIAEDTGGGVRGNHVDIYFPDLASALRFGVQNRTVTVLS
jgi:3D (Asp-Asp-Asp) domain-containing protein